MKPAPTTDAEALRDRGYTAYHAGDMAGARQHFARALALFRTTHGEAHPVTATAYGDLGAACASTGDHVAARDCHEAALRLRRAAFAAPHADIAASLQNLGVVYRQLGRDDEACAVLREAAAMWAQLLGPGHPRLETCHRALGAALNNLGVAQRNAGALAPAAENFAAAVRAHPDLLAARHNLAALLSRLGLPAAAKPHLDYALARQSVFIEAAPHPAYTVLLLAGPDSGHVPIDHLLPPRSITRIWWFVGASVPNLPAYDVVFNAMGDPDVTAGSAPHVAAFMHHSEKPVLNHPARVQATRRDRLSALFADVADCVVPNTLRIMSGQHLPAPPFLLRPAGAHGGVGLQRIDTAADCANITLVPGDVWYATPFVDCRAADGFVRKYRIIFVDGVPYPYHLAISDRWLVHYVSAGMPGHDWKLREEQAFLADWRSAIGPRAASAITHIGARLGLAYGGIDFSILPDGRLVVFEANATMLVHPEDPDGKLAYKNQAVTHIVEAMQNMLEKTKKQPNP